MEQYEKDKILDNFHALIHDCRVEEVAKKLLEKKVITKDFIDNAFNSNDKFHNRRLFFFGLFKRDIFKSLIESLRDTNHDNIIELLLCHKKHAVAFKFPDNSSCEILNNNSNTNRNGTVTNINKILEVNVVPATHFRDLPQYNNNDPCYSTRSKQRGAVLIINNYEYQNDHTKEHYREGAQVDEKNIKELFEQMGLKVYLHSNKTKRQMEEIVKDFTYYSTEKICDMCFVVVMSHGQELYNDTGILTADNHYIRMSWIIDQFNNVNCNLFMNKPKIFMFQICRGNKVDYHIQSTKTDSSHIDINQRTVTDQLTCHATIQGYKAHRDEIRGSWYIELICDVFMKHAHEKHLESLLKMVDRQLSKRVSEKGGMQTSTFHNEGFKNCYIHPGIYEENGKICSFF